MPLDSAGRPIRVKSRVRFRGKEYTIKEFYGDSGSFGTQQIKFEEEQHTEEIADEISVNVIKL